MWGHSQYPSAETLYRDKYWMFQQRLKINPMDLMQKTFQWTLSLSPLQWVLEFCLQKNDIKHQELSAEFRAIWQESSVKKSTFQTLILFLATRSLQCLGIADCSNCCSYVSVFSSFQKKKITKNFLKHLKLCKCLCTNQNGKIHERQAQRKACVHGLKTI